MYFVQRTGVSDSVDWIVYVEKSKIKRLKKYWN